MGMTASNQVIKIAILAMGGEGGGVLADWIVDLGEAAATLAQTTSVPGVAQRTGATIYYVELYSQSPSPGRPSWSPVLALDAAARRRGHCAGLRADGGRARGAARSWSPATAPP
jgi:Pyruvate/2-oxoacid:ferredoxin oxidoreductase gamma subunit